MVRYKDIISTALQIRVSLICRFLGKILQNIQSYFPTRLTTDYWSDAFRTREISFLKMEISKSGDFFQNLKKASENVTMLMPVNYKSQTNSAIAYSDFALEGMPITNSFAIADVNNDGLNDIVGVGSNTSDTWNGQAILNFYLQNANGGLDQYISQVATEAKGFSFISSINLIDINADQKVDVVISGRTRQSDNGNTIGFINNTEHDCRRCL